VGSHYRAGTGVYLEFKLAGGAVVKEMDDEG